MIMPSLEVVKNREKSNFDHLRRHDAIEQGRANALDLLVKGEPLQDVLSQLIFSLENSTDGLVCAIMLVNEDKTTLSPFAAPSLPQSYLIKLRDLPIGPDVGCCGAAAYHRQLVITDEIDRHPNWFEFKEDARQVGVKSCWSYPIISPDDEIFGTFSMYFEDSVLPDQDDIDSLNYEAKIVALILERARNINQLKQANHNLENRVSERTKELTESNNLLKKALEQRNEVQTQLVEMENMAALGTMMSSLTHEINTPVGVAITAISHLGAIQADAAEAFERGEMKRSELQRFFAECQESCEIIERNLIRSTQLIKTFKQLSIDQHSQDARDINLCGYIDEILLSLKPKLKRTKHQFCIDVDPDLTVQSNPGAISQLLINLIINSAQHGFTQDEVGHIFFKARVVDYPIYGKALSLTYQDNGKGMSENTVENIYKPFFTLARNTGGSGLGMNICYNLVVKVLKGQIDCYSTLGKGVEFRIVFPIQAD